MVLLENSIKIFKFYTISPQNEKRKYFSPPMRSSPLCCLGQTGKENRGGGGRDEGKMETKSIQRQILLSISNKYIKNIIQSLRLVQYPKETNTTHYLSILQKMGP